MLLGNGLCVSPLKGHNNDRSARSLRDVVFEIDNAQDLNNYITSFSAKAAQRPADIKYQPHSVSRRVVRLAGLAPACVLIVLSPWGRRSRYLQIRGPRFIWDTNQTNREPFKTLHSRKFQAQLQINVPNSTFSQYKTLAIKATMDLNNKRSLPLEEQRWLHSYRNPSCHLRFIPSHLRLRPL